MVSSQEAYQEAYNSHYKKKNLNEAYKSYLRVISNYPDTPEFRYAHQQISNLLSQINLDEINVESDLQQLHDAFRSKSASDAAKKEEQLRKEQECRDLERESQVPSMESQRREFERLRNMLIATVPYIENHKVIEYLGIVKGECILGTGIFSEINANVSDFWGSSATLFENKLSSAKDNALTKMKRNAFDEGANAVIGVNFNTMVLGNNMIGVSVYGTAVNIEKMDEN